MGEENKKALLMMSGGRDSFLAACRLVEDDYQVYMVTYDNGRMSQTENVLDLMNRIEYRFGEERIKVVGIHTIASNIRPLMQMVLYNETINICEKYPHLLLSQLNCLVCHTVMYFHSIAYCKQHDIHTIAEGLREEQKFFVELPEMKERYEALCEKYGIKLELPVYDLKSDLERKDELAEWGFHPKTYEPQCWIGCPILADLTKEQRSDLAKYYDNEIEKCADEIIGRLVSKKKVINTNFDLEGKYV